MSLNYIIASSNNTLERREPFDKYCKYILQYHLQVLNKLLDTTTIVKQITIGCQMSDDYSGEYYNIQKQIDEIRQKGIRVEQLQLPKEGISYTQYVRCYEAFPEYDYYLLMEDDWVINIDSPRIPFDTFLVNLYEKTFSDKMGFLNCWSPKDGIFIPKKGKGGFYGHIHHSAIALGILSNAAFKAFINNVGNLNLLEQVSFSEYLVKGNVKIIDLPQLKIPTQILFWQTKEGVIKDYTEFKPFEAPFFVPIQFYYGKAVYVNMITKQKKTILHPNNMFNQ